MLEVATSAPLAEHREGWKARLELAFEPRGDRTVLVRKRHEGPLMVQSPFYPEGPVCHVYVLHPPGGLVAGDSLELEAEARSGSHVLMTTPAATKLYRSGTPGRISSVEQRLRVHEGSVLEWLPQETLAFPGARSRLCTRVQLDEGARFIGWESVCLGRPASDESFVTGRLRQDFELWCDDVPLMIERNALEAETPLMSGLWGLGGRCALATLMIYPGEAHLVRAARLALKDLAPARGAATLVDGVLACRILSTDMMAVKARMIRLWQALRPLQLARPALAPRIWAT